MKFEIDLDTLALTAAVRTAKRGDAATFEVSFLRTGIAEDLPDDTVITFAAKALNDYTGDPVVFHNTFTRSEIGTDALYSGNPSFNTEELNALFVAAEGAAQIDYVDLIAEFSWATSGGLPSSSKTFFLRVERDVFQGTEGTPLSLPTPEEWLAAQLASGDYATAAPLALGMIPQAYADTLTVSATGVTVGGESATIPKLYRSGTDHGGRPFYSSNGVAYADSPPWYAGWEISYPNKWSIWQNGYPASWDSSAADVATPDLAAGWTAGSGAGGTITDISRATEATPTGTLGQLAIVTHSDSTQTEWGCVDISPMTWLPRTAGIVKNRTTGQWEHTFISAGTIQTEILPNQ